MSLWKLRWKLFADWVRMIQWGFTVVLAAVAAATLLFLLAAEHYPWAAAAFAALIPLRLHAVRKDLRLISLLCRGPEGQLAGEYLATVSPCCLLLALHGAWAQTGVLAVVAAGTALLPQPRHLSYSGRRLRIGMSGFSVEWTAGLRRHPIAAASICTGLLVCCLLPFAGFPALYLAALLCQSLYADNEPLELLLLPQMAPERFLSGKIRTAWRNYFLLAAPFALLSAIYRPEAAWLAAIWAPMSALMLVYFVTAKYAAYDPASPAATASTASLLGLTGFIVWPLLPATLILLVNYALRAEKNLNRYLYDYD